MNITSRYTTSLLLLPLLMTLSGWKTSEVPRPDIDHSEIEGLCPITPHQSSQGNASSKIISPTRPTIPNTPNIQASTSSPLKQKYDKTKPQPSVQTTKTEDASPTKYEGFVLPPVILDESFKNNEQKNRTNRAKAALSYINHINWVIAKLGEMNDLLILEQEYENLTDNSLNLAAIEDETTVAIIQELMDFIVSMEKNSAEAIYAQLALSQAKRDAIYQAIPSGIPIVGIGPTSIAIAVAGSVVSSVQNYFNAKAVAEKQYNEKNFNLFKEKLDYLNDLNKELFMSQWRLIRKYNLDDYNRVTRNENQLLQGLSELLAPPNKNIKADPILCWQVLKNNERTYRYLNTYWVNRITGAHSILRTHDALWAKKARADLLYSCEKYFDLLRNAAIIRKDSIACSIAMLYVATYLEENPNFKNNPDAEKHIREWFRYIEINTRITEPLIKRSLALMYLSILNDRKNANRLSLGAFLDVHACLSVYNQSRKNIFSATPTLRTAMTSTKKHETSDTEQTETNPNHDFIQSIKSQPQIFLPTDAWLQLYDTTIQSFTNEEQRNRFIEHYTYPMNDENNLLWAAIRLTHNESYENIEALREILRDLTMTNEGFQSWTISIPRTWMNGHEKADNSIAIYQTWSGQELNTEKDTQLGPRINPSNNNTGKLSITLENVKDGYDINLVLAPSETCQITLTLPTQFNRNCVATITTPDYNNMTAQGTPATRMISLDFYYHR